MVARADWQRVAPAIDPARFVFLDESGVATDLLRRYGRSRRGTRIHDHAPHQHWQTSTFVAGLRVTGLTAPGLLDGPMDGDCFLAYLDQVLAPTLQVGDIVVMDNLGSHHVEGVRERIEAAGASGPGQGRRLLVLRARKKMDPSAAPRHPALLPALLFRERGAR